MWQMWLSLDMIWIGRQFHTRKEAEDYRALCIVGALREISPAEALESEIHLNHVKEPELFE